MNERTMLNETNPYKSSIITAVILQFVLFVLTGLMLDGGLTARLFALSFLAFWIAFIIIKIRRPKTPTKADLIFIRWGIIPIMVVMALFTALWQRIHVL